MCARDKASTLTFNTFPTFSASFEAEGSELPLVAEASFTFTDTACDCLPSSTVGVAFLPREVSTSSDDFNVEFSVVEALQTTAVLEEASAGVGDVASVVAPVLFRSSPEGLQRRDEIEKLDDPVDVGSLVIVAVAVVIGIDFADTPPPLRALSTSHFRVA